MILPIVVANRLTPEQVAALSMVATGRGVTPEQRDMLRDPGRYWEPEAHVGALVWAEGPWMDKPERIHLSALGREVVTILHLAVVP